MTEDGLEIFVGENAYGDLRAWSHYPGEDPHVLNLDDTVRELSLALARAEAAEAERNRLMRLISVRETDWDATKARLAAVLALCSDDDPEMTFPEWQAAVRAAALGDGGTPAPPAEPEMSTGDGISVVPTNGDTAAAEPVHDKDCASRKGRRARLSLDCDCSAAPATPAPHAFVSNSHMDICVADDGQVPRWGCGRPADHEVHRAATGDRYRAATEVPHEFFGLTPTWSQGCMHGIDMNDPDAPWCGKPRDHEVHRAATKDTP